MRDGASGFWLLSGQIEAVLIFAGLSVADLFLYWSRIGPTSMGQSRSEDPDTTCPAAALSDDDKIAPTARPSFLTTRAVGNCDAVCVSYRDIGAIWRVMRFVAERGSREVTYIRFEV